ncbi:hypothetical protein [Nioella nitratireducens]|uniref:hypothetical protein n=1 Tax=Nioella nitratireducens TaxID=1287720 RepID=UPI0008FD6F6A|nr:hypothetical protein [Nioella nitratireducens]
MTRLKRSPIGHVLYRLYCLRRLIAVSVLTVTVGAVLSLGVSDANSLFAEPLHLFLLMLVWGAITGVTAVVFPTAWIDILTSSIAFALLLIATPYLQLAIGFAPLSHGGIGETLASLMVLLAWFLVWLMVMALFILAAESLPRRKGQLRTQLHCAQPPEVVRAALRPKLGVEGDLRMPHHQLSIRILQEDAHMRQSEVKVTERGQTSRVEMFERFVPKGDGTIYERLELHDQITLMSTMAFWINDLGADRARACLDAAEGRRTLALFTRRRSAFGSLSHWLKRAQS